MLQLAARRTGEVRSAAGWTSAAAPSWVTGDMLALPFPDGHFTVVTTGYGLRNVPDLDQALGEIRRVLAPGGRLLSLDFNRPGNPLIRGISGVPDDRRIRTWPGPAWGPEYLPLYPRVAAHLSGRRRGGDDDRGAGVHRRPGAACTRRPDGDSSGPGRRPILRDMTRALLSASLLAVFGLAVSFGLSASAQRGDRSVGESMINRRT